MFELIKEEEFKVEVKAEKKCPKDQIGYWVCPADSLYVNTGTKSCE